MKKVWACRLASNFESMSLREGAGPGRLLHRSVGLSGSSKNGGFETKEWKAAQGPPFSLEVAPSRPNLEGLAKAELKFWPGKVIPAKFELEHGLERPFVFDILLLLREDPLIKGTTTVDSMSFLIIVSSAGFFFLSLFHLIKLVISSVREVFVTSLGAFVEFSGLLPFGIERPG